MNNIFEEANETRFLEGLISFEQYKPFEKIENRDFWNNISAEVKEALSEGAKVHCNFEWQGIRAVDILKFSRTGDRCEERSNNKRRVLLELTLAECIVNDGKYIDDIVNGVWSICEESCWASPAHIDTCGGTFDGLVRNEEEIIDLHAGETAQLIAFVYYMLKDKFEEVSPVINERIKYELYRRIIKPYLNRNDYWWIGKMGRTVNNWNPWCNSNILLVICCVFEDMNLRKRVIRKIIESLDVFLEQYPSDGSCDEGTSYWFRAGGKLINALEILNTVSENKLNIKNIKKVANIGKFILNTRLCENYYINFADGSAKIDEPDAYAIYGMGELFDDKDFLEEGAFLCKYRKRFSINDKNSSVWEVMRCLKYYDKINKNTVHVRRDKNLWLEGTQTFISRMNNDMVSGLIISAKGGTNGDSHNHNDIGNFIVYNNAKPAIIDVGVGTYTRETFSDKRYTIWTMQSLYHNLPIINGEGEHEGKEYAAENISYSFSDKIDLFSLDIGKAYEATVGIKKYNRSFVLNRDEKYISVTDEFEFKNESETELILMLPDKPDICSNQINTANCTVEVMCKEKTQIICEELKMTDKKMIREWGDTIFRVHIKIENKVKASLLTLKITG